MPLAITGGPARFMSRETQAGVSCSLPLLSSTLNAAIAPCSTSPYSSGALNAECFAPQNGVRTQRVPLESCHEAIDPQIPAEAKFTSSLQISGVRKSGVR